MIFKPGAPVFSILDAAFAGYQFTFRNWRYLSVIGIVPFVAEIATAFLVRSAAASKESLILTLMMGLPSLCMAAWFMFLAFRLAILGERADALPKDRDALLARGRLMWASIIIWMLFNMGVMICAMLLLSATKILQAGPNVVMTFVNFFTIGFCFWAARLGVLHYLAAVDYPLNKYLTRVRGLGISLRLIGLSILCVLPCGLVQQALMMPFLPEDPAAISSLPDTSKTALMIVGAAFSVAMTAIMTGACASALKQMLGDGRP